MVIGVRLTKSVSGAWGGIDDWLLKRSCKEYAVPPITGNNPSGADGALTVAVQGQVLPVVTVNELLPLDSVKFRLVGARLYTQLSLPQSVRQVAELKRLTIRLRGWVPNPKLKLIPTFANRWQ